MGYDANMVAILSRILFMHIKNKGQTSIKKSNKGSKAEIADEYI